MRITFVMAHVDLSGGVRMVASYAQHLTARGHEVTVVSRPPRPATFREKLRAKIKGRPLPTAARHGPSHLDSAGIDHRVISSHRPITAADVPDADVVIATWWETAHWVAAFPARKGAPVSFLQGYEARDDLLPEVIDTAWRLPMHKIVIARWLGKLAEERFGDTDYSLVPNAIDIEKFSVPPRGKQEVPTVGMVYTHVATKGCDIALRAFQLAKEKIPNLRMVAFGSRPPTADLPLPPRSQYTLQPPQQQIKEIYSKADAWLFASRQEGFGLPLLEAMAGRTPVLATPAGAAPELLTGGGGILIPPEDPQAMANGILSVCGLGESAWRQMSDKAYATACRYNWEQATTLFEAALHKAMEKSLSPVGALA